MMNIGGKPLFSDEGIVTSIAWGISGKVDYVLEGNINYTGGVIKWLVDDLGLLESPQLSSKYAVKASPEDDTYLVPAFSGLGAPYWVSDARALFCGMSRTTGKAEIVRAALDSIAYQVADVIDIMLESYGKSSAILRVDGGATKNTYLMQFQSDILNLPVVVPSLEELSGIGVAYMAGIALGLYNKEQLFSQAVYTQYNPLMENKTRTHKREGWKAAVRMII